MENITNITEHRLVWCQKKSFVRSFELRGSAGLVGTLDFHSEFGMAAIGTSYAGTWTFDRVGFFNPQVEICDQGTGILVAVYSPKFWGDGILNHSSGNTFSWTPLNFWRTRWGFTNKQNKLLIAFNPGGPKSGWKDLFKKQAVVEVEPLAAQLNHLTLLILAGWYLANLQDADNAAAAAAVSASSAV